MKPGIAAENLICAFSCKGHFIMLCHQRTEIEHGRFHISHTGQIPGIYGFIQTFDHLLVCAGKEMMTGTGVFHHFLHPGPVLGRLKGIGLKISVISLKIKGESMEYLPLFLQLPGTDGCDQGTVHPSGEKGTDGNIRKHLKLYRILHQPGGFFHSFFKAVFVGPALQLPVLFLPQSSIFPEKTASPFYFQYIPEYPFPIGLCRTQGKDLAEALLVCHSFHTRILEQAFDLRRKYQGIPLDGVK